MKSKILFLLLAIVVGVSIYLTYERTIIRKDFETYNSEETTDEGASDEAGDGSSTDESNDTATTTATTTETGS
ncbi:MAG: hypothetical protein ACM3TU_01365 [Bacillota bacterium]